VRSERERLSVCSGGLCGVHNKLCGAPQVYLVDCRGLDESLRGAYGVPLGVWKRYSSLKALSQTLSGGLGDTVRQSFHSMLVGWCRRKEFLLSPDQRQAQLQLWLVSLQMALMACPVGNTMRASIGRCFSEPDWVEGE